MLKGREQKSTRREKKPARFGHVGSRLWSTSEVLATAEVFGSVSSLVSVHSALRVKEDVDCLPYKRDLPVPLLYLGGDGGRNGKGNRIRGWTHRGRGDVQPPIFSFPSRAKKVL